MIFAQYIQPVAEPVGLVEMKLHLRVDTTTDDELIKTLISAARQWCEGYEGQSYMVRSYKLYLDQFEDEISLPMPPLVSVDSVQYYDTAGSLQTLATSYYTVDTDKIPGRIYLAYGQTWPSIYSIPKAVIITFTAGYSTSFTAATNDYLTVGNAVFADTDMVRVFADNGDLPAGLSANTNYYVRDKSGSTCKLALTSGGTAIDITDAGTGTQYIAFADTGFVPDRARAAIKLITAHLYEHRELVSEISLEQIPFAAKNLLFERVR